MEALEFRVHTGPPIVANEVHSARTFLQTHEFSTASDYFHRLGRIQSQLTARPVATRGEKRNYGGEAAGCWMQIQSIYDHVILSTCHDGEFNTQRGRVKLSHRFNTAGRIDFVELKFLRSLHPQLNGALRKLVTIQSYPGLRKDWHEADAFALPVLPQELVFLFGDVFRSPRDKILAWLINIGHRITEGLLGDLRARGGNGSVPESENNPNQLCLKDILTDQVALPILQHAAGLESAVEVDNPERVVVRYIRK